MPTHKGHDSNGSYYQWGDSGKKYYYKNSDGASRAKSKADAQGRAAYANGYKGD